MDLGALLGSFVKDSQFTAVAVLIALDIVLGVGASFYNKGQEFALHYLANFTRNDVLGKVFPWFVLWAGAKASHGTTVILGIDMGNIADGVWVGVVAALVGSLTTSLSDFGITLPVQLGRGGNSPAPPAK
jgi:hypothetical protein